MSYRKFRADHIFTGDQLLDKDHVLITDYQGKIEAIEPLTNPGEDVLIVKGILTPGFINCHCHLELSHLKGLIPEKTGMVDFLLGVLGKRNYSNELVQSAIADAEQSMLENGIVAVGDICNTTNTFKYKTRNERWGAGNISNRFLGEGQTGEILMRYHNFIEVTGFIETTATQRLDDARKIFNEMLHVSGSGVPIEHTSIVPHAPYSVSPGLFRLITHFPGNSIFTIHNQESQAEDEFFKKGTGGMLRLFQTLGIDISFYKPSGKSSLQTYLPWFLPNQTIILVHNVTTGKEDMEFLTSNVSPFPSLFFCLCPNANLYIGNGLPGIDLFRQYKEKIVVGTDSLASNHVLSIAAELATIHKHFPRIGIPELLQWATLNGAKALGLDSLLGSFDPGKTPGVLIIKEDFSEVRRLI